MNKYRVFGLIVILIIVLTPFLVLKADCTIIMGFWDVQITSDPAQQENPDIYEYGPYDNFILVYQDNRAGNWDIYIFAPKINMVNPEIQITTSPANQINPKIYNDIIVYQDDRNGNWDIYLYNLTSQTETQITTNTASQENPVTEGKNIVYIDDRNGNQDIYLYNLTSQTEQAIAVESNYQEHSAAISGNRIVYIKERTNPYTHDYYLMCYDLSTKTYQTLSSRIDFHGDLASPAIEGSTVVWNAEDQALPINWEVYMRDLATNTYGSTWSLGDETNKVVPDIYDKYLVVERYGTYGGNHQIHMYNTEAKTDYKVHETNSYQLRPRISAEYGNYIVYMDNRNGNWDIYLNSFGYIVGGPPPSPSDDVDPVLDNLHDAKTIIANPDIIPLGDFDGANNKVKENRRSTLVNKLDSAIKTVEVASEKHGTNFQGALNQLKEIWEKMDGSILRGSPDAAGSGFTPDWIITEQSQGRVWSAFTSAVEILESLNQNE